MQEKLKQLLSHRIYQRKIGKLPAHKDMNAVPQFLEKRKSRTQRINPAQIGDANQEVPANDTINLNSEQIDTVRMDPKKPPNAHKKPPAAVSGPIIP